MMIKYFMDCFLKRKTGLDYFKVSRINRFILGIRRIRMRAEATRKYRDLQIYPNLNQKYAYFALQFRPERSLVPEGGDFADQITAIALLRNNLPPEYVLYVKEHPRQLGDIYPELRRINQGEAETYTRIARLPGVALVPIEYDTKILLQNASLTGSISGSTVWQGVCKGCPGVVFSMTWHSECQSTPNLAETSDPAQVIKHLLSKTREEVIEDRNLFLESKRKFILTGSFANDAAKNGETNYTDLVSKLANHLADGITNKNCLQKRGGFTERI
jgi:hypothetical protein